MTAFALSRGVWMPSRPAIIRAVGDALEWLGRSRKLLLDGQFQPYQPIQFQSGQQGLAEGVGLDGGGNDAFTKLLLHCEGANNSTTFTDSSADSRTVTRSGSTVISTAQFKFGSASVSLSNGSNLSVTMPAMGGAQQWTVDLWFYYTAASPNGYLIGHNDSPRGFLLGIQGGAFVLYLSSSAGSWNIVSSGVGATSLSTSTWHHCALVFNGTTYKIYLNGVQDYSLTSSTSINNSALTLLMGENFGGSLSGNEDEVRVSIGIARWTSNFTPPTGAYS